MTDRDHLRLVGVVAPLVTVLETILDKHGMFVVEGVRTVARQQALYAQGRTAPGSIVTYKDGITHKSNHQPHDDGFGYAVDCAFIPSSDRPDPFDQTHPWEAYGEALEAWKVIGIVWGGRWSMHDLPHAELDPLRAYAK